MAVLLVIGRVRGVVRGLSQLELLPGMIHGFVGLHGTCPEPAWAVAHAAQFIARHARAEGASGQGGRAGV